MPTSDESRLVAVLLAGAPAVAAVTAAWSAGEAVSVVDPSAPPAAVRARLEALRPAAVVDDDGRAPWPGALPVPSGTAAVIATSGTSAEPKLVVHTHGSMGASARAVNTVLGAEPGDAWLACVPLSSIAGLAIVARAAAGGQGLEAIPRFDPDVVAAAGRRGAATLVSLVPTMLRRLLRIDAASTARFRHILVGGGPVPPGLLDDARASGASVSTTYGQTETGGGCVHDGRPLPGVELRIDATTGEILVRGEVVTPGYLRDPDATAARLTPDGWWRTGDAGLLDEHDRLVRVERLTDVVITGGVNVSPTVVEAVLATHPAVSDVVVTGAPDPEWGERVVAHVVLHDPSDGLTLDALREHGRTRGLTPAELPRELRLVAAVARTAGGKPLRRRLSAPGDVDQVAGRATGWAPPQPSSW